MSPNCCRVHCIVREIKRSATSGPHPTFPCPLCKRTIQLASGRRGVERVDSLETDRLLKDILARLEDETSDVDVDVCGTHRTRLEMVCYSCKMTGCVRCAWEKHRRCSRVENFAEEAARVERLLKLRLRESSKRLKMITSYNEGWTRPAKSHRNQMRDSVYSVWYTDIQPGCVVVNTNFNCIMTVVGFCQCLTSEISGSPNGEIY